MDTETVRKQYLPKMIHVLLVGESPPHNGKFFYVKSPMTTFTSRPFERVYNVKFRDNSDFLHFFRDKGCFLDDIVHEPVDHLKPTEREARLRSCVPGLASRLREWQPEVVCIVLKKIKDHVQEAIRLSGIETQQHVLPFPGNGWQNRYMDELEEIILAHLISTSN